MTKTTCFETLKMKFLVLGAYGFDQFTACTARAHCSNTLVSEALTKACHPFQRLWAQHLPPFLPCRIHRRYEIKGLAWPGRERDYDSKSQEEFNE
jgi:hypothetical protein